MYYLVDNCSITKIEISANIDTDNQNLDHYHVFRKCDLIRKDYSDYR